VATALGIRVRTQSFRGSVSGVGGLCKLKGETVVFLNLRAHEDERALALAAILRDMDTHALKVSEDTRDLLNGAGRPRPVPTPLQPSAKGPGLTRARPRKARAD